RDALLGITELRIKEAALPFNVSARCGLQRLSGGKVEVREFAAPVTGFGVQFGDMYVPQSGAPPRRRRLFELPGRGGVGPVPGIQVPEALVQRGGIRHAQRILQVRDRRSAVSELLIEDGQLRMDLRARSQRNAGLEDLRRL